MTFNFVSALPFPFLHVVNGSLGNQSLQVQRMYHQVNLLSSYNVVTSKCCDIPRGQSSSYNVAMASKCCDDYSHLF